MKLFDTPAPRARILALFCGLLVLAFSSTLSTAASPRYRCTILDDSVGGAFIEAHALNNNGDVVGTVIGQLGARHKRLRGASEMWHGFLWSDGRFTDIGVLPNSAVSDATSINDHGQIVGTSGPLGRSGRAFVWQNGKMRPLATRYGLGSMAHWIDNGGWVAGNAETADRRTEAAVWTLRPGVDPERVAPWMVPGQDDAEVVNNLDQVLCSGHYQAYLWSAGRAVNLGTLGGAAATGTALNDHGQVVGVSVTNDLRTHMFLWQNGVMTDLDHRIPGQLHVPIINAVSSINNYGQIVGIVTVAHEMHAMLFENGNIDDLNEFITPYKNLTLEIARAINDRGQIIGEGHVGNRPVSFLLTPLTGLRPPAKPSPVRPILGPVAHPPPPPTMPKRVERPPVPRAPAIKPPVLPPAPPGGE